MNRLTIVSFIITLIFFSTTVSAQDILGLDKDTINLADRFDTATMPDLSKLTNNVLLEQAISHDEYIVGPGDLLVIGVWGQLPLNFTVPIMADGMMIIPKVGVFDLRGKTLTECRNIIADGVKKYYKFDDLTLNLAQPRQFRVMAFGEVIKPGGCLTSSVTRLDAVLEQTGGINTVGSWQRIMIKHSDDSETVVNLLDFFLNGDVSQNPVLQEGDRVIVPPAKNAIQVRGLVNLGAPESSEGMLLLRNRSPELPTATTRIFSYELVENESLISFFDKFRGFAGDADLTQISIEYGSMKPIFDLTNPSQIEDVKLRPGMTLSIPKFFDAVYVSGAVAVPGVYPYAAGKTMHDYVRMAGGVDPRYGNEKDWKLVALDGTKRKVKPDYIPQRGEAVEVPRRFGVKFQEYLSPIIGIASVVISAVALSTR